MPYLTKHTLFIESIFFLVFPTIVFTMKYLVSWCTHHQYQHQCLFFTLSYQPECLSKVANFLHPTDIFSTCAWMMQKPFAALLIFHRRFLTFQCSQTERDAFKSPWLVEFNLSLGEIATCIIHFLHLTLYTLSSSFPPNILVTSSAWPAPFGCEGIPMCPNRGELHHPLD